MKTQRLQNLSITLGSDPEIFVENKEGRIVSGIDLIPGDKEKPHPITSDGHFIQVDNIAWEFNIPASTSSDEFSDNIQFVLDHLKTIADEHGLVLSNKVSDEIDPSELEDPRALVFGCDPDYNAYTLMDNPTPDNRTNLRCVGGHVHIGYHEPSVEKSIRIVKLFDLFVVLPSMMMDDDVRRRELYGRPGSFRFKKFGLECRSLSNFWIHDESTRKWVYDKTTDAVLLALEKPEVADEIIDKYSHYVTDIVMNNNKEEASEIIEAIAKELESILN